MRPVGVERLVGDLVDAALLGSGSATAAAFLCGDRSWKEPTILSAYTLSVQALTSSPAASVSRYFGNLPKEPATTADTSKVYIPKAGTITRAEVYCYSGTAGTSENWSLYVRLNNTTDTLIATVGAAASERVFSNNALSIAVVAGDYIEIKMVNPAWVTNPLTTIFGGYLYIQV